MEYLTTDTELGSVADAIRSRGGTSAPLAYPNGFVSAIQAIQAGETVDWSTLAMPLRSQKHIHGDIPVNTQEAFRKALNLADLVPEPYTEMSAFSSSVWYRFSASSSGTAGFTIAARSRYTGFSFGTIAAGIKSRIGPAFLDSTLATNVRLTVGIKSDGTLSGVITNLSAGSYSINAANRYSSRYLSFTYYSAVSKQLDPYSPFPDLYWTRDLDGKSIWISGSYSDPSKAPRVNSQTSGPWNAVPYEDVYVSDLSVIGRSFFTGKSGSFRICGTDGITQIGHYAFAECNLLSAVFPACLSLESAVFESCKSLSGVSLPSCSVIGTWAFHACIGLSAVSLPACRAIHSYAFSACRTLLSLYLMGPSLCTLSGSQAFTNTPIAGVTASTGGVYGSIYVPLSLLSSYQAAANWSWFSDRFAGVE